MPENDAIRAARKFFHVVFSQDADIEYGTTDEAELFAMAPAQLSDRERPVFLTWLEELLSHPDDTVRDTLIRKVYIEMEPDHWADPDDPARKGASELVRHAIKVMRGAG